MNERRTAQIPANLGPAPAVEIRHNADGSIDEIVAKGATLHIEQMTADGWYMGLDMPDGSLWQFWFGSKNRRAAVEFRHTETTPK